MYQLWIEEKVYAIVLKTCWQFIICIEILPN